jgi:hypothetical protein
MKYGDIEKLHDAGLITGEQQQKIVGLFDLKEDGGGKLAGKSLLWLSLKPNQTK